MTRDRVREVLEEALNRFPLRWSVLRDYEFADEPYIADGHGELRNVFVLARLAKESAVIEIFTKAVLHAVAERREDIVQFAAGDFYHESPYYDGWEPRRANVELFANLSCWARGHGFEILRDNYQFEIVDSLAEAAGLATDTPQSTDPPVSDVKLTTTVDTESTEADETVGGEPKPLDSIATHSQDFRSVWWFGTEYIFTVTQAGCVQCLWEHWEAKATSVSEITVLNAGGSAGSRLRDVFAKGKHPAWGTMITSPGKGAYQLSEPSPSKNPDSPQ